MILLYKRGKKRVSNEDVRNNIKSMNNVCESDVDDSDGNN